MPVGLLRDSGILGFDAAEWLVLAPSQDLAELSGWVCLLLCKIFLIHWHISCLPRRSCPLIGVWVLSVLLFFGLAFVLFCFVSAPIRTLDCVMVRASLLTPQGGTLLHALANSFISTNTVWRPGESCRGEGRKKRKKHTPLWCEAHLRVKKLKTPHVRTAFGSSGVEKVRSCGAKHISKSKCTKHTRFGPLLEVEMSKKCTPLWREAHFEVKTLKTQGVRTTFGGSDVVSRGRRKGLCTLSKVSKTWGFCRISKHHGRRAAFEEDLERCILRGRRSIRDMFILARQHGHQLLQVQPSWDFNNICPCANTFCFRGVASPRPRRASERLDSNFWSTRPLAST